MADKPKKGRGTGGPAGGSADADRGETSGPHLSQAGKAAAEEQRERRAQALRANLKRRKDQLRARAGTRRGGE